MFKPRIGKYHVAWTVLKFLVSKQIQCYETKTAKIDKRLSTENLIQKKQNKRNNIVKSIHSWPLSESKILRLIPWFASTTY